MALIQDLENYITTKGYYTSDQLEAMQFEIGERIEQGSTQWDDLYTTLLYDKIVEQDGSLDAFESGRDNERAIEQWENELLFDIVD